MPTTIPPAALTALAEHCRTSVGMWSDPIDLGDGRAARVKVDSDDIDPFSEYGCYGRVEYARGHDRQRPTGFTGAARKLASRFGPVWWQPPADLLHDPDALAAVTARVEAYFRDDWSFVAILTRVFAAPCACCGERKETHDAVGAVESDSDAEHFRDLLTDLLGAN